MKRLLLLLIISTSFLTNAQVPSHVPTDGLVGWYSLESSLANSVNPSEVASGSATLLDSAAFFDNTELLLPNSSLPAEFSISFEFWVDDLDVQGGQYPYLMGLDENEVPDFPGIGYQATPTASCSGSAMNKLFLFDGATGCTNIFNSTATITEGSWNRASISKGASDLIIQLNGEAATYPGAVSFSIDQIRVGNRQGGLGFQGHIRRVGLWNRALNEVELEQLDSAPSSESEIPSYVPTDGLVGWFPLDGNIVNEVNGAVGNTISTTAEPDRTGQASASLGFNGSAYGVLNNAGMPTGEFSVSAWVKQSQSWSTGNGIEFICVGSASNTAWGTIAGPEFIHLNRGRGCSGNGQVLSGVNFPLNEWVHLTYVCAGIGANADIYLNGEYAGQSLNLTSGSCGSSNLYFGVDIFSAPEYITGGLDDVGIWNRQLSAEEVQQVFASEPPPAVSEVPDYVPTDGLVAWYPFNGNANDESGNGHDGTMDGALFGQDREGSASASATFDGVDDGIFIPHHADFESAEKTISFWMNPTSNQLLDTPGLNDGMGILNKTDHTASNTVNRYYAVTLGQGTAGTAPFSLTLATSTGNIVTTGSSVESTTAQDAININEWQHVSAVQTATELKLYLNGIQISSSPLLNPPLENDYDIKIGVDYKFNEYRYFNGSIDDISFHNRALSEDEIAAMAGTSSVAAIPSYVPTDGLVAWYPFNGNAEDESGNGFDGTVDGAVLGMDRFSNPNRAYVFDGDDRIFPANPEGFPTQERTTSVWMKSLNAATGGRVLMGYGGSSCGNSWILTYNNQGHLPSTQNAFEIQGHCNNNAVAAPLPPEELTDWHLVVVRTSAQGTDILIDGVLAQHASLFIDDTAPGCAVFGASPSTGGGCYYEDANNALWDGWLDDIGIWNRALSDEEVLALYNAAPPILGCTDPDACNLDPTANSDDGSCEYGCQYCGPGTVWDPVLQFCVAEVPEANAAEDCSLFTLQELSTGYLNQQQQMDALDTLVVTQQAAIDSLNALLNNCTGND